MLQSTLGLSGLQKFTAIACGDQVKAKKPAPDIYLLALSGLDMRPGRAIAFEDSPNGLRSATAAGLRTVVTPNYWTEDGDFSAASLLLPSLAGLGFDELMARIDRTQARAT